MGKNSCAICNHCEWLYRYWSMPWRTDLHYCVVREDMIDTSGVCEMWQRKRAEYDLSPQRFDDAEQDIMRIAELMDVLEP